MIPKSGYRLSSGPSAPSPPCRGSIFKGRRPHAVHHLGRHPVIRNERRAAIKTAGITLHHEVPERLAGLGNEAGPLAITSLPGGFLRMRSVVGPHHRERGFQTPPLTAERGGFFLPMCPERTRRPMGGVDMARFTRGVGKPILLPYIAPQKGFGNECVDGGSGNLGPGS